MTRRFVVVQNQDAADAVRFLLPAYMPAVITDLQTVDLTPFADSDLLVWPTVGGPYDALIISGAQRIRHLDISGHPVGWDAATALADGWTKTEAVAWARSHIRMPPPPAEPTPPESNGSAPLAVPDPPRPTLTLSSGGALPAPGTAVEPWTWWPMLGLAVSLKGVPFQNLSNAELALANHPDTKDRLWADEFHRKMFTTWHQADGQPAREITDADSLALAIWLQRDLGLVGLSDVITRKAIRAAARRTTRNEPKEWLTGLDWDRRRRIHQVFPTYFGAPRTPYTQAAGANFMRTMVARVFQPGCQMDNMVVLEGAQGIGKSSALRILGGRWYTEAHESVQSKDFYLTLQGKLLVEIAEMDSFGRAEINKVKAVVSNPTDRFRTPYGELAEDYPRQSCFIGTTNESTYLKDPSGGRRFWPITCGAIRLDALARDREQLFAEAVADVQAGQTWYEMPDAETRTEQADRRMQDEWEQLIARYEIQYQRTDDQGRWIWVDRPEGPITEITISELLHKLLQIPAGKWGQIEQRRVAEALRARGWGRVRAEGGMWVYRRLLVPEERQPGED